MGNLCKFSTPEVGNTNFEMIDNNNNDLYDDIKNFTFKSKNPISFGNNMNNRYNNENENNINNEINKNENNIIKNEIKEEPTSEKKEKESEIIEENKKLENEVKSPHLKLDYNKEVFELINKIRQDPSSYAKKVEDAIQYINEVKETVIDKKTGQEKEIIKRTFKKKLKVALTRGEIAFRETADLLRKKKPVEPFIFNKDILIPLPNTIEEMKDPNFLKNQAEEKKNNSNLELYFKDLVKIPEISVLLMIVDDNGKNSGKKRYCLLNDKYKYISINSKFIDKSFIAYFSFAK